jgi:hypothetical protein
MLGVVWPLADVIYSNSYSVLAGPAGSGQYLNSEMEGEVRCHHLAFKDQAVDWEIWVEEGSHPLPRKLSTVYKNKPGSPRYCVRIIDWQESPSIPADRFTFDPPQEAARIEIMPPLFRRS